MKKNNNAPKTDSTPAEATQPMEQRGRNTRGIQLDLLREFKAKRPDSTVLRLIEENRLAVWQSDTAASVVFVKARHEEIEEMLAEMAMVKSGKYKMETNGRKLDGWSFRAEDALRCTYYVLAISDELSERLGIPVLAHEATHTAVKLLTDHRLPLDAGVDGGVAEPLCYLVGTLVRFGMHAFWPDKYADLRFNPVDIMMDVACVEKKASGQGD